MNIVRYVRISRCSFTGFSTRVIARHTMLALLLFTRLGVALHHPPFVSNHALRFSSPCSQQLQEASFQRVSPPPTAPLLSNVAVASRFGFFPETPTHTFFLFLSFCFFLKELPMHILRFGHIRRFCARRERGSPLPRSHLKINSPPVDVPPVSLPPVSPSCFLHLSVLARAAVHLCNRCVLCSIACCVLGRTRGLAV